jgi:4-hydroxymandelate oxidase
VKPLLNLFDYGHAAAQQLDPKALGYFASGADDEVTLGHNRRAWEELRLRPRAFTDVSKRDLSTTVLGHKLDLPFFVAPMAFQQMAHPEGELATVRAAGDAGTAYCLSTISNKPVEEVLAAATGPVFFQLYVIQDRERGHDLVARVAEAGCQALVVTVDTPLIGNREADSRTGFTMPTHLRLPNLPGEGAELKRGSEDPGSALFRFAKKCLDPSLSWKDLEAFASRTSLPVIAKGILRADDARRAVDHGAKGIVVSNHGGRQLDTSVPTAWALPEIVAEVGSEAEVYVDGGIRRGTDVLKALSMGARAVLVGRPVMWGLALNGQQGVAHVLQLLKEEVDLAFALAGCRGVADCTPDLLWKEIRR